MNSDKIRESLEQLRDSHLEGKVSDADAFAALGVLSTALDRFNKPVAYTNRTARREAARIEKRR